MKDVDSWTGPFLQYSSFTVTWYWCRKQMEESYIYLCENDSKIRNVLYIGWVNIFNQILSREWLLNEEVKRYIMYCLERVNIVYEIASWGQLQNEEVKTYIMYCLEPVNIFNRIVSWEWLKNEEVKRYIIWHFSFDLTDWYCQY